jgi:pimeloyl-ACP methyl ester carboxylesterase
MSYVDAPDLLISSAARHVIAFDNAGVGGSTGATPATVTQMAHEALAFLDALQITRADLLGFSIGSFVAQEIDPMRPDAAHGFLFQHHAEFAEDVEAFLDEPAPAS